MCYHAAATLRDHRDEIEAAGFRVVLIGIGNVDGMSCTNANTYTHAHGNGLLPGVHVYKVHGCVMDVTDGLDGWN